MVTLCDLIFTFGLPMESNIGINNYMMFSEENGDNRKEKNANKISLYNQYVNTILIL